MDFPQNYIVRIDIHELKNCRLLENGDDMMPNPFIEVNVGSEKGVTPTVEQSNMVTFNSQFSLNLEATQEELKFVRVEFRVFHAYTFSSLLIGTVAIGCSYIYNLPRHALYREWVAVRHERDPGYPSGQLLLTIGIYGPEDSALSMDVITMNPLPQSGMAPFAPSLNYRSFTLTLNIFRGQNIFQAVEGMITKNSTSTFIRVSHAGFSDRTESKSGVSPEWNTSFLLPVFIPSMDPYILIELGSGKPGETQSVVAIEAIALEELIHESTGPRWLNFYYKPKSSNKPGLLDSWIPIPFTVSSSSSSNAYAGRVLYSTSVKKVEACSAVSARPSPVATEPPQIEQLVLFDVYEVIPYNEFCEKIYIQISIGIHTQTSDSIDYLEGSYFLDENTGRFSPIKLYLPPLDQVFDFFVYIMVNTQGLLWSSPSLCRIAYMRDSLSSHFGFEKSPAWFEFWSMTENTEAFSVLMAIEFGPVSMAPTQRSLRLICYQERFLFRAMIYEAINVPCISNSELPSASVSIRFSGHTVFTRCIEAALYPAWYETFEIDVNLPSNLKLAPYIKVDMCCEVDGKRKTVGYFQYYVESLPRYWDSMPMWCQLKSPRSAVPKSKGKLLCSFELVPNTPDMLQQYPFYDDIRPSVKLASVYFYLIGIQLFKPVQESSIRIAYGRSVVDLSLPLWSEETEPPLLGEGGNWFFFKESGFVAELPKRCYHYSYLELTVSHSKSTFQKQRTTYGYSYVLLTSRLPWLSLDEKKNAAYEFNIREDDEDDDGTMEMTKSLNNQGNAVERIHNQDFRSIERKVQRLSVPRSDLDYANAQMYLLEDIVKFDAEDLLVFGHKVKAQKSILVQGVLEDKVQPKKNLQSTSFMHTSGSNGKGGKSLNFDFCLPMDDADGTEKDEIRTDLEADIMTEKLPYEVVPVIGSTGKGSPEILGYLKYICCVNESTDTSDCMVEDYKEAVNIVKQLYIQRTDLVVRVYILTVSGLKPSEDVNKPMIFPCVRNGVNNTTHLLPHDICDTENGRPEGLKLEYNKCYILNSNLPEYGLLHIFFKSVYGFSETIVGETYVDIESRWFHPEYQALLEKDALPIESRTLRCDAHVKKFGRLRVLIEIMPYEVSLSKPLMTMARSAPENYQLRVVIWSVSQAPISDGQSVSLFVRGSFGLDGSNRDVQDTDIHYNSKDGCARFNWRFVWNIKVPTTEPYLKLQILSYMILPPGSVVISECKIPKKYYVCSHPAYEGQSRGSILAEISILPRKEANLAPVGKGRENPNRNPYLEPVNENRTYADWKTYQDRFASITSYTVAKFRHGFYIMIFLGVIGLLIFLYILFR